MQRRNLIIAGASLLATPLLGQKTHAKGVVAKVRVWVISPFPRQSQATHSISAVPRELKRFTRATRMWISATARE